MLHTSIIPKIKNNYSNYNYQLAPNRLIKSRTNIQLKRHDTPNF